MVSVWKISAISFSSTGAEVASVSLRARVEAGGEGNSGEPAGNWLVAAPELVLLADDSKSRFPWLAAPVDAMALKLAPALSFLADSGSIADLNELVAATPANCPTGFAVAKES